MKRTITLVALMLLVITVSAQDVHKSDTTKLAVKTGVYYMAFDENALNVILKVIQTSDEPYVTVRKPLIDMIIYQAQHQPILDSAKNKFK